MGFATIEVGAPESAQKHLNQIRNQGIFYLKLPDVASQLILDKVIQQSRNFYNWNERTTIGFDRKRFVGYNIDAETTNKLLDRREMFDWATESPPKIVKVKPWDQLIGDSIWPSESALPGFKASMKAFETLSHELAVQTLKILGLEPIIHLHKDHELDQQCRSKIVHYPRSLDGSSQGCGLHTDCAEWLTIIYEDGEASLEVEVDNEMVLVPPMSGHLTVIIGQPLEDCTSKLFRAAPHQVLLSERGDRYSAIFSMSSVYHLSVADVRRKFGTETSAGFASEIPLGEEIVKHWNTLFNL